MSVATNKDFMAELTAAGNVLGSLTAGGSGDNTAIYTDEVDRRNEGPDYEGGAVLVSAKATLTAGKKLDVAVALQHTDDADFNTPANITTVALGTLTLEGGDAGGVKTGDSAFKFDSKRCKSRWRVRLTPNLDAANTDTAIVAGVVLLGGVTHLG